MHSFPRCSAIASVLGAAVVLCGKAASVTLLGWLCQRRDASFAVLSLLFAVCGLICVHCDCASVFSHGLGLVLFVAAFMQDLQPSSSWKR